MYTRCLALCCLLACSMYTSTASAGGGRLAAARREVAGDNESSGDRVDSDRPPRRAAPAPTSTYVGAIVAQPVPHRRDWDDHHHHHHHDCQHDESDDDSQYYAPIESLPVLYASYPYASPLGAYVLDAELLVASAESSTDLDARLRRDHAKAQPWAGHLMLDAGYLYGVAHATFDARVRMPGRAELAARNSLLYEPSVRDYSHLGAVDLSARAVQLDWLMVHVFAGVIWFGHAPALEGGAEVGLGFDAFLGRPFVLSGRAIAAFMEHAAVPSARLQLGYLFGRVEVFAGYEFLQIGSVDLSTPFAGTRLWL